MEQLARETREALRTQASIRSLADVVTELLSNSLEAQSSSVTITLLAAKEAGVLVCDDGHGIQQAQLPNLGVRYASSKSHDHAQLGYRGEALASIAHASASLQIVTRTSGASEAYEKQWQSVRVTYLGRCRQTAHPLAASGSANGTHILCTGFSALRLDAAYAAEGSDSGDITDADISWGGLLHLCAHKVLCTALPFTHVAVKLLNPRQQVLLELSKGRSLPLLAPRLLNIAAAADTPAQPSAALPAVPAPLWLEEAEHITPAALRALPVGGRNAFVGAGAPGGACVYRLQGVIMDSSVIRSGPDSQYYYINHRHVQMPNALRDMVTSQFRGMLLREWMAAQQADTNPTRQSDQDTHPAGRMSAPAASLAHAEDRGRALLPGGGPGAEAAGRRPARGRRAAPPAILRLSFRQIRTAHPAFLLLLDCPTDHVIVDGEADKSRVTVREGEAVTRLVGRFLARCWEHSTSRGSAQVPSAWQLGGHGMGLGTSDTSSGQRQAPQQGTSIAAARMQAMGGALQAQQVQPYRPVAMQQEQQADGVVKLLLQQQQPTLPLVDGSQFPSSRSRSLASVHPGLAAVTPAVVSVCRAAGQGAGSATAAAAAGQSVAAAPAPAAVTALKAQTAGVARDMQAADSARRTQQMQAAGYTAGLLSEQLGVLGGQELTGVPMAQQPCSLPASQPGRMPPQAAPGCDGQHAWPRELRTQQPPAQPMPQPPAQPRFALSPPSAEQDSHFDYRLQAPVGPGWGQHVANQMQQGSEGHYMGGETSHDIRLLSPEGSSQVITDWQQAVQPDAAMHMQWGFDLQQQQHHQQQQHKRQSRARMGTGAAEDASPPHAGMAQHGSGWDGLGAMRGGANRVHVDKPACGQQVQPPQPPSPVSSPSPLAALPPLQPPPPCELAPSPSPLRRRSGHVATTGTAAAGASLTTAQLLQNNSPNTLGFSTNPHAPAAAVPCVGLGADLDVDTGVLPQRRKRKLSDDDSGILPVATTRRRIGLHTGYDSPVLAAPAPRSKVAAQMTDSPVLAAVRVEPVCSPQAPVGPVPRSPSPVRLSGRATYAPRVRSPAPAPEILHDSPPPPPQPPIPPSLLAPQLQLYNAAHLHGSDGLQRLTHTDAWCGDPVVPYSPQPKRQRVSGTGLWGQAQGLPGFAGLFCEPSVWGGQSEPSQWYGQGNRTVLGGQGGQGSSRSGSPDVAVQMQRAVDQGVVHEQPLRPGVSKGIRQGPQGQGRMLGNDTPPVLSGAWMVTPVTAGCLPDSQLPVWDTLAAYSEPPLRVPATAASPQSPGTLSLAHAQPRLQGGPRRALLVPGHGAQGSVRTRAPSSPTLGFVGTGPLVAAGQQVPAAAAQAAGCELQAAPAVGAHRHAMGSHRAMAALFDDAWDGSPETDADRPSKRRCFSAPCHSQSLPFPDPTTEQQHAAVTAPEARLREPHAAHTCVVAVPSPVEPVDSVDAGLGQDAADAPKQGDTAIGNVVQGGRESGAVALAEAVDTQAVTAGPGVQASEGGRTRITAKPATRAPGPWRTWRRPEQAANTAGLVSEHVRAAVVTSATQPDNCGVSGNTADQQAARCSVAAGTAGTQQRADGCEEPYDTGQGGAPTVQAASPAEEAPLAAGTEAKVLPMAAVTQLGSSAAAVAGVHGAAAAVTEMHGAQSGPQGPAKGLVSAHAKPEAGSSTVPDSAVVSTAHVGEAAATALTAAAAATQPGSVTVAVVHAGKAAATGVATNGAAADAVAEIGAAVCDQQPPRALPPYASVQQPGRASSLQASALVPPPARQPVHDAAAAAAAAATGQLSAQAAATVVPAAAKPGNASRSLVSQVMQGWEISGAAFQRRALSSRAILTLEQLTQHTPPTTLPNTTTAAARNAAQAMSGAATGVEMEAGTAALAGRMSGGAADAKGPRSGSAATALVPARATLADLCNCRVLGQIDKRFILAHQPTTGALLAIDQHAAHERCRLQHLTALLHHTLQRTLQHTNTHVGRSDGQSRSASDPVTPSYQWSDTAPFPQPVAPALRHTHMGDKEGKSDMHVIGGDWNTSEGVQEQGGVCGAGVRVCVAEGSVWSARRGNGGGPEPPALVSHTLQSEVLLRLSSPEARAARCHADTLTAWGWRLQPIHTQQHNTDTSTEAHTANTETDTGSGNVNDDYSGIKDGSDRGMNGDVVGSAGLGPCVMPTYTYALTAAPCVFGMALTISDLHDYLALLADTTRADTGAMQGAAARAVTAATEAMPQGAVRVLRSRACRTAIMFGDAISHEEATELVRALSTCQLWYACAHGRPTTAPLVSIPTLHATIRRRAAQTLAPLGRTPQTVSARDSGLELVNAQGSGVRPMGVRCPVARWLRDKLMQGVTAARASDSA